MGGECSALSESQPRGGGVGPETGGPRQTTDSFMSVHLLTMVWN